jgi:hypothetical protein
MPGNPTEAREHAANCFRIAETATSPTVQKTFFDLARQWNRLASDLEDALRLLAGPHGYAQACTNHPRFRTPPSYAERIKGADRSRRWEQLVVAIGVNRVDNDINQVPPDRIGQPIAN